MQTFLFALIALVASVTLGTPAQWKYVRVPVTELATPQLTGKGFIRDHLWDDEYAFGYVPKDAALGAEWVELDPWEWATHLHDAKSLRRLLEPAGSQRYEPFHTYDTLTVEMKKLAAQFPHLMALESAGKSVEGRELWLTRLTSNQLADVEKPKLLYVSSMHGDEVTGKEMMIYLIRELLNGYGKDARLTALLDQAEIFIMPSMNPDGTEKRQRWNADGVDLNRDFPDLHEGEFSTSGRAVETVALMELHRRHRFILALNFHGGSLCVNIPWDSRPNSSSKFGDDAVMRYLAYAYAGANGPMSQVTQGSFVKGVTYGYEWYPVYGGMQDWASFFRSAVHATLEISQVKWPQPSQLPRYWSENRESLLLYLEGGLMGIHLKVTDGLGKPLEATVEVDSATRPLKYEGNVHRITKPGLQRVTVSSPGFVSQTFSVEAWRFDGSFRKITLARHTKLSGHQVTPSERWATLRRNATSRSH